MKKNKHILVNLTENDYNTIAALARNLRRNITELASMILIDNAAKLFIEYHTSDNLKPARFIPSNGDIDDIKL